MAQKGRKGGQIDRQVEWLKTPAINEKTGVRYEKQVGYYVQAEGSGFENVLDKIALNNLSLIDKNQTPDLPFIRIGGQSFSVAQLVKMEKDALKWLNDGKLALVKENMTFVEATKKYFGDLSTAIESIEFGSLKINSGEE